MLGDPERQIPGMYLLASHDIFSLIQKVFPMNILLIARILLIKCGCLLLWNLLWETIWFIGSKNLNLNQGRCQRKCQSYQFTGKESDFCLIIDVSNNGRVDC